MPVVEKLKLWVAAIIVVLMIYAVSYAELSFGVKFGVITVGMLMVGGLVFFSQGGRNFSQFLQDSIAELRKVVWPTKQETMQLTGVVFLFLIAATLFLWLADFIISYLLDSLTG